jgi:hypothetical protein
LKLRTFTGLDKEATCACGCKKTILANPNIKVVVDMDSFPRKRYLPGHEPGGRPTDSPARGGKEETKSSPSPSPSTPAPAGPAPTTPAPTTEPTPSPSPKPSNGVATTLADNRSWSIVQVVVSVGPYESVKVGVADFGAEGESLSKLRERVASEVAQELERQVKALQSLHQGKAIGTTQGAAPAPSTPSMAMAATKPPSAQPTTPEGVAAAMGTYYQNLDKRMSGEERSSIEPLLRQVDVELNCDASAVRTVKKRDAAAKWLQARGYPNFTTVVARDEPSLRELLARFETINNPESAGRPPVGPAGPARPDPNHGPQIYG